MKICIIGPSHLAALRDAETQGLVDTSAHDITWCGHLSKHYRHVTAREGQVFLDTPEPVEPIADDLHTKVTLADFDLILCHTAVLNYRKMMDRARLSETELRNYSAKLVEKAISRTIREARIFRIANEIRAEFDGPVIVSSTPLLAAPARSGAQATAEGDPTALLLEPLVTSAIEGLGFHFLPQPPETIVDGKYTADAYTSNSVNLAGDKRHGRLDVHHMNAHYGALVLRGALAMADAFANPVEQRRLNS